MVRTAEIDYTRAMHVYLGADHRGFQLKEKISAWLSAAGHVVTDLTPDFQPDDDYPAIGRQVAEQVTQEADALGIVCCGSGVGISIAANKVAGARCGLGFTVEQVRASRHDDGINVLAISSDYIDEALAVQLVDIYLHTAVSQEERHQRRRQALDQRNI